MTSHKTILTDLTRAELEGFAVSLGEPAYRGRQLYQWITHRRASAFSEMTDLSAALRTRLASEAEIGDLELMKASEPTADGTRKLLFGLRDGLRIESVYLPEVSRRTVCVSTQVGCAMGCAFCATGSMGFHRNLTMGEIVLQVIEIERLAKATVTNVVFMGMGEPLHNYEQVTRALAVLTSRDGLGLSKSRLTVSTVGIVPMIERWTRDKPPAKLALSLHATTDERRAQIMPAARSFPLSDVMKALRRLAHVSHSPITFEYVMIAGFNDRHEDAKNIKRLVANIPAKVNLIRLHPTGSGHVSSSDAAIRRFMEWLSEAEITCTLRASRGVQSSAACGMLSAEEPPRARKRKTT